MTTPIEQHCELHPHIETAVEEISRNMIGRWFFTIIMGIFLSINAFLWVELKSLSQSVTAIRQEMQLEVRATFSKTEERRDAILTKLESMNDKISQLDGKLDAHLLTTNHQPRR